MATMGMGITNLIPDDILESVLSVRFHGEALLLTQLPCGVIAVNDRGRVALVNAIAESLWPGLIAVIGPQPLARPAGGWYVTAESQLAQALRGEDPPAVDILEAPRGVEGTRAVRVVATPLRGDEGRIAGAVAVCTVLPEADPLISRAEPEGQANRELVRSNNELEQFASIASHDLQEPLRKILAFGNRLQRSDGAALSPRGQDSLERMLGAAGRMQTLINDLLALARVTTAGQPFVPVEMSAIASGVLGDLETQIARCGGRVVVGALPTIEADPLQLRQLLQNLISNALKFQRQDCPPEVSVTAEVIDSPIAATPGSAPWYRLVVQDNGIGFEHQYADRIFRVFERLHGRTEYEGTGIGLALCRHIAERHGGDIRAEGTPGKGAIFLITLPTHQGKGAAT